MCGIYNIVYRRYFAVPFVSDKKRIEFLEDVKKTANNLIKISIIIPYIKSSIILKNYL